MAAIVRRVPRAVDAFTSPRGDVAVVRGSTGRSRVACRAGRSDSATQHYVVGSSAVDNERYRQEPSAIIPKSAGLDDSPEALGLLSGGGLEE
jgi:hypothetical protein